MSALSSVLVHAIGTEWNGLSRQVLDKLDVPVALFDQGDSRPRLATAAWLDQFGDQELPTAIRTGIERSAATDEPMQINEARLDRHRFGFIDVVLSPVLDAQARRVGTLCLCSDVTGIVLARLLSIAPGTLVWSGISPGEADYQNDAYRTYVGEPNERAWHRAVHPGEISRCVASLAEATLRHRDVTHDVRLRRRDGAYRWHHVRFVMLHERWFGLAIDGHETRALEAERATWRDRIQLARAESEQAHRLKDEFLAKVSHELRTPVATMMLWEQVLREPAVDGETRSRALDAIAQSALMQARLVGDLLDVARGTSGKLHLDLRPLDINRVVRDSVVSAGPAASAKSISLEHRESRPVAGIHGDPLRLRQVIDNLLSNAIKFTQPGGRVTVSTQHGHRGVSIEVRDSGRGIAHEQLPRVFEVFHQGDDRARRESGLGLGLAISKQLVELHFGTIEASSPGIGQGTTLTVTLPSSYGLASQEDLASLDVLVIESDARVRGALEMLFSHRGASIRTAESATRGQALIADARPDVLVCDISMPDENGHALIRRLRARGSSLFAIALSSHTAEVDHLRALDAGFDVHLPKPVAFERLVQAVRSLVGSRQLPRDDIRQGA